MEVSFCICTEELMEEMDIDSTVETLVSDAVGDEILSLEIPDWCDIHEAINEGMVEYAEAMEFITVSNLDEYCEIPQADLQNEIEGLRDRIEYLEYTRLSARFKRGADAVSSAMRRMTRRVHWHMPRR